MLSAFLLIITTSMTVVQNVLKKYYNGRTGNKGPMTFCWISAIFAIIAFALSAKHPMQFDSSLVPYSIGFAVAYTVALVFSQYALQTGSLAITSLILSYSLLVPTFYGILFLNEVPGWSFWVGIILLVISIFLMNYSSESGKENVKKEKVSVKWIVFVILAFIGNGMCSTAQTIQLNAFKDFEYPMNSEFMILALVISSVSMFIISLFSEKKDVVISVKHGWYFAVLCGAFNGLTNLLVMLMQKMGLPVSILFPCVSGGGMIITYVVSRMLFKEKMTRAQTIGFFVSVASVVFLNL